MRESVVRFLVETEQTYIHSLRSVCKVCSLSLSAELCPLQACLSNSSEWSKAERIVAVYLYIGGTGLVLLAICVVV